MVNKKINLLRRFHELIIILWFTSVYLMFFSDSLKFAGVVFLILVGGANLQGACPLTRLEKHLIASSGSKEKIKNFTPRFFKKYFGFEISYKLTLITMGVFSLIALFHLIRYFILPII